MGNFTLLVENTARDVHSLLVLHKVHPKVVGDVRRHMNLLVERSYEEMALLTPCNQESSTEICRAIATDILRQALQVGLPKAELGRAERRVAEKDQIIFELRERAEQAEMALEIVEHSKKEFRRAHIFMLQSYFREVLILRNRLEEVKQQYAAAVKIGRQGGGGMGPKSKLPLPTPRSRSNGTSTHGYSTASPPLPLSPGQTSVSAIGGGTSVTGNYASQRGTSPQQDTVVSSPGISSLPSYHPSASLSSSMAEDHTPGGGGSPEVSVVYSPGPLCSIAGVVAHGGGGGPPPGSGRSLSHEDVGGDRHAPGKESANGSTGGTPGLGWSIGKEGMSKTSMTSMNASSTAVSGVSSVDPSGTTSLFFRTLPPAQRHELLPTPSPSDGTGQGEHSAEREFDPSLTLPGSSPFSSPPSSSQLQTARGVGLGHTIPLVLPASPLVDSSTSSVPRVSLALSPGAVRANLVYGASLSGSPTSSASYRTTTTAVGRGSVHSAPYSSENSSMATSISAGNHPPAHPLHDFSSGALDRIAASSTTARRRGRTAVRAGTMEPNETPTVSLQDRSHLNETSAMASVPSVGPTRGGGWGASVRGKYPSFPPSLSSSTSAPPLPIVGSFPATVATTSTTPTTFRVPSPSHAYGGYPGAGMGVEGEGTRGVGNPDTLALFDYKVYEEMLHNSEMNYEEKFKELLREREDMLRRHREERAKYLLNSRNTLAEFSILVEQLTRQLEVYQAMGFMSQNKLQLCIAPIKAELQEELGRIKAEVWSMRMGMENYFNELRSALTITQDRVEAFTDFALTFIQAIRQLVHVVVHDASAKNKESMKDDPFSAVTEMLPRFFSVGPSVVIPRGKDTDNWEDKSVSTNTIGSTDRGHFFSIYSSPLYPPSVQFRDQSVAGAGGSSGRGLIGSISGDTSLSKHPLYNFLDSIPCGNEKRDVKAGEESTTGEKRERNHQKVEEGEWSGKEGPNYSGNAKASPGTPLIPSSLTVMVSEKRVKPSIRLQQEAKGIRLVWAHAPAPQFASTVFSSSMTTKGRRSRRSTLNSMISSGYSGVPARLSVDHTSHGSSTTGGTFSSLVPVEEMHSTQQGGDSARGKRVPKHPSKPRKGSMSSTKIHPTAGPKGEESKRHSLLSGRPYSSSKRRVSKTFHKGGRENSQSGLDSMRESTIPTIGTMLPYAGGSGSKSSGGTGEWSMLVEGENNGEDDTGVTGKPRGRSFSSRPLTCEYVEDPQCLYDAEATQWWRHHPIPLFAQQVIFEFEELALQLRSRKKLLLQQHDEAAMPPSLALYPASSSLGAHESRRVSLPSTASSKGKGGTMSGSTTRSGSTQSDGGRGVRRTEKGSTPLEEERATAGPSSTGKKRRTKGGPRGKRGNLEGDEGDPHEDDGEAGSGEDRKSPSLLRGRDRHGASFSTSSFASSTTSNSSARDRHGAGTPPPSSTGRGGKRGDARSRTPLSLSTAKEPANKSWARPPSSLGGRNTGTRVGEMVSSTPSTSAGRPPLVLSSSGRSSENASLIHSMSTVSHLREEDADRFHRRSSSIRTHAYCRTPETCESRASSTSSALPSRRGGYRSARSGLNSVAKEGEGSVGGGPAWSLGSPTMPLWYPPPPTKLWSMEGGRDVATHDASSVVWYWKLAAPPPGPSSITSFAGSGGSFTRTNVLPLLVDSMKGEEGHAAAGVDTQKERPVPQKGMEKKLEDVMQEQEMNQGKGGRGVQKFHRLAGSGDKIIVNPTTTTYITTTSTAGPQMVAPFVSRTGLPPYPFHLAPPVVGPPSVAPLVIGSGRTISVPPTDTAPEEGRNDKKRMERDGGGPLDTALAPTLSSVPSISSAHSSLMASTTQSSPLSTSSLPSGWRCPHCDMYFTMAEALDALHFHPAPVPFEVCQRRKGWPQHPVRETIVVLRGMQLIKRTKQHQEGEGGKQDKENTAVARPDEDVEEVMVEQDVVMEEEIAFPTCIDLLRVLRRARLARVVAHHRWKVARRLCGPQLIHEVLEPRHPNYVAPPVEAAASSSMNASQRFATEEAAVSSQPPMAQQMEGSHDRRVGPLYVFLQEHPTLLESMGRKEKEMLSCSSPHPCIPMSAIAQQQCHQLEGYIARLSARIRELQLVLKQHMWNHEIEVVEELRDVGHRFPLLDIMQSLQATKAAAGVDAPSSTPFERLLPLGHSYLLPDGETPLPKEGVEGSNGTSCSSLCGVFGKFARKKWALILQAMERRAKAEFGRKKDIYALRKKYIHKRAGIKDEEGEEDEEVTMQPTHQKRKGGKKKSSRQDIAIGERRSSSCDTMASSTASNTSSYAYLLRLLAEEEERRKEDAAQGAETEAGGDATEGKAAFQDGKDGRQSRGGGGYWKCGNHHIPMDSFWVQPLKAAWVQQQARKKAREANQQAWNTRGIFQSPTGAIHRFLQGVQQGDVAKEARRGPAYLEYDPTHSKYFMVNEYGHRALELPSERATAAVGGTAGPLPPPAAPTSNTPSRIPFTMTQILIPAPLAMLPPPFSQLEAKPFPVDHDSSEACPTAPPPQSTPSASFSKEGFVLLKSSVDKNGGGEQEGEGTAVRSRLHDSGEARSGRGDERSREEGSYDTTEGRAMPQDRREVETAGRMEGGTGAEWERSTPPRQTKRTIRGSSGTTTQRSHRSPPSFHERQEALLRPVYMVPITIPVLPSERAVDGSGRTRAAPVYQVGPYEPISFAAQLRRERQEFQKRFRQAWREARAQKKAEGIEVDDDEEAVEGHEEEKEEDATTLGGPPGIVVPSVLLSTAYGMLLSQDPNARVVPAYTLPPAPISFHDSGHRSRFVRPHPDEANLLRIRPALLPPPPSAATVPSQSMATPATGGVSSATGEQKEDDAKPPVQSAPLTVVPYPHCFSALDRVRQQQALRQRLEEEEAAFARAQRQHEWEKCVEAPGTTDKELFLRFRMPTPAVMKDADRVGSRSGKAKGEKNLSTADTPPPPAMASTTLTVPMRGSNGTPPGTVEGRRTSSPVLPPPPTIPTVGPPSVLTAAVSMIPRIGSDVLSGHHGLSTLPDPMETIRCQRRLAGSGVTAGPSSMIHFSTKNIRDILPGGTERSSLGSPCGTAPGEGGRGYGSTTPRTLDGGHTAPMSPQVPPLRFLASPCSPPSLRRTGESGKSILAFKGEKKQKEGAGDGAEDGTQGRRPFHPGTAMVEALEEQMVHYKAHRLRKQPPSQGA